MEAANRLLASGVLEMQGWWQHRVITGPLPVLYDCFNRADLLISDISSVVSDFIAAGKPYVVTNPDGLDEREFGEKYPAAAAGYLLEPDCASLSDILAQAAAPGDDRLAEARRELRRYLLGPDDLDAQTRFAAAVDALAEPGHAVGRCELDPRQRTPRPAGRRHPRAIRVDRSPGLAKDPGR